MKVLPKQGPQKMRGFEHFRSAFIIVLLAFVQTMRASDEFTSSANYFGICDDVGYAQWSINLGDDFLLSNGERLSCVAVFSSNPQSFGGSCLGKCSSLPLMESRAIQVSEKTIVIRTPGGCEIELAKLSGGKAYVSYDRRWSGTPDDSKSFSILGPSGWRLKYKMGTLQSAFKGDVTLTWSVAGKSNVLQMKTKSGLRDIFRVERDGPSGSAASMLLPDDGIIKMSSAQVPRLQATARGILVVGFDSAVGSFGYQDGSTRVFEYTFDPISSCSAITMDSSGPGYKLPQRKLEWSSASGVIVRGDDQKFLVERSNGALFPKITSIDSLGVRSTFQINAAAATVTKTTGGVGSKVQYYFASPGALYMKTRKVERFQEGVTAPIQSLRWRYDASGALIEE